MSEQSPADPTHFDIGGHWVWLMDVVFGGIVTIGFERLIESVLHEITGPWGNILCHFLVAACFFAFVIYDVGVYHVLIRRYPYTGHIMSAARYALDLVMAFCLLVILRLGLDENAGRFAGAILWGLTGWHAAAASWHISAHFEKHRRAPPPVSLYPHFAFVLVYWGVLLIWCVWNGQRFSTAMSAFEFLQWLAFSVLLVSIFRSVQVMRRFA